jgi:hypothetical protein
MSFSKRQRENIKSDFENRYDMPYMKQKYNKILNTYNSYPADFANWYTEDGKLREGLTPENETLMLEQVDAETAIYHIWYPNSLQSADISRALEDMWTRKKLKDKQYTFLSSDDAQVSVGQKMFFTSKTAVVRTSAGHESVIGHMTLSIGQGTSQNRLTLQAISKDDKIPGISVLIDIKQDFIPNLNTTGMLPIKKHLKAAEIRFYQLYEEDPTQEGGIKKLLRIKVEALYTAKTEDIRHTMLQKAKHNSNFQHGLSLGAGKPQSGRGIWLHLENRRIRRSFDLPDSKIASVAEDHTMKGVENAPQEGQDGHK